MNSQVAINHENDRLVVYSSYHPAFPSKAKALGGRWDAWRKVWTFDPRDEARVRDLAREVYGTDGTPRATVTVRKTYTGYDLAQQNQYEYGREVLYRPGRDAPVRLGEGVILLEGKLPVGGGSGKYPKIADQIAERIVLEIRDVPASMVTEDESTVIVDAAADRREALAARIAELEAELAKVRAELAALEGAS